MDEDKKVLVSENDLKDLVRSLKLNIWALENGRVDDAIVSLTKLKDNVDKDFAI